MLDITLEQILACPNLPTLPTVAVEVLRLTSKRGVQLDEIATVIQNDPALCARVLKTVNSSFYGLSQPCPTMTRVLSYLGLNTVKSLVLGFSLVDCAGDGEDERELQHYWSRCVLSAAISRRLATLIHYSDPEEAFLAALMQDIGVLALRRVIGSSYCEIVATSGIDHHKLPALCRQTFGFDHPEVGAALAQRWRLADIFVAAIREHHRPINQLTGQPLLVRVTALSSHLVTAITTSQPDCSLSQVKSAIETEFKLSQSPIDGLIADALEDARSLSSLLKVSVEPFPDVASILAQADEARLEHQLLVQREAQALQEINSDLIRLVLTDPLTQAGNRKHFDAELAKSFGQTRSYKGVLALLMLDADNFKAFNDAHGHQAGDAVLIEIARRMIELVGEAGIVCRYGGEEFAVILPGAGRPQAVRLAESVRSRIEAQSFDIRHLKLEASSVCVTVSLGVAVYEPASCASITSPQLLIQAADRAMYAAKNTGRNCVRLFSVKAIAA